MSDEDSTRSLPESPAILPSSGPPPDQPPPQPSPFPRPHLDVMPLSEVPGRGIGSLDD